MTMLVLLKCPTMENAPFAKLSNVKDSQNVRQDVTVMGGSSLPSNDLISESPNALVSVDAKVS